MLSTNREASFLLVSNIPPQLHSSHLREYFSQFVEKKGFLCFHYRHRPEYVEGLHSGSTARDVGCLTVPKAAQTNCCVVAVRKSLDAEFFRLYQGTNWIGPNEKLLSATVKIKRVVVEVPQSSATPDSTPSSSASTPHWVPWSELSLLPELNPPTVMPQGNVGTSLNTFTELIRQCKLPSRVIRKLSLEFPKSRTRRRYGAVQMDYGTSSTQSSQGFEVEGAAVTMKHKAEGAVMEASCGGGVDGGKGDDGSSDDDEGDDGDGGDDGGDGDDDGDDVEEWDKYEALHDDVDKQERTEERLHEEELEVVWEKGGSGLVFYTDANYWDEQDGDFDEKCSKEDDWDVDLAGYYSYEGADKDARDLRDMQVQGRLRDHGEELSHSWKIGQFEKHTKGIGSKLLKRSGWKEGSGVGVSSRGITEPLDAEGQLPQSRKGLGYHGEPLLLSGCGPVTKKSKPSREAIISTIYDKREEEKNTPLRTAPPRTIKYRDPIRFTEVGSLKEARTLPQQPGT